MIQGREGFGMGKMLAGIIGCGNISSIYFENLKKFEVVEVIACADLDIERARAKAEKYQIPHAYTPEELLADPAIDIVINLTIPAVHAEVAQKALQAGKHVYGEKPLAVSKEEGRAVLETASNKGLHVGNAPDTFLGGGLQTSRKLLDDGWIGKPVSAVAFMMVPGHERWHPDPAFYYQEGGGPMFDMGPYYLTALTFLLGPVSRVTGSASITFPERTITSEPKFGEKIQVTTPTQINGVVDFSSGAIASIITSFDTWHHQLPHIEIYGTEGSMIVPDPNTFGGPVFLRRQDDKQWTEVPLSHGFAENSRGIGVAEMAYSILAGRQSRADGEMAYHILEIMHGFLESSQSGKHVIMSSSCSQPDLLPTGVSQQNFDKKMSI